MAKTLQGIVKETRDSKNDYGYYMNLIEVDGFDVSFYLGTKEPKLVGDKVELELFRYGNNPKLKIK